MKKSLIFLFGLLLLPVQAGADEGIPAKILQNIKNATVFVRAEGGFGRQQSGTGFVMKVAGETAWIVTNHHVVNLPKIRGPGLRPLAAGPATFTVVFHGGTKQEQTARADLLAGDPEADLAILKVAGFKNLPLPIDLERKAELNETMVVYTFGFPFGKTLATSKGGHPAITVGKGTVSSIRRNDKDEVAVVQIDGALNPGNSGGPIVDSQGRLVGVAVASIRAANIGFAIPPHELRQMLAGRLGKPAFFSKIDKGTAEVRVVIPLVDPLAKIKTVRFYYLPSEGTSNPVIVTKEDLAKQPKAQMLELKIETLQAQGVFQLPLGDKDRQAFTWQVAYALGNGRQVFNEPKLFTVNRPPTFSPFVKTEDKRQTVSVKDLDKILADLKGSNRFQRQSVVRQLANIEPSQRRAEVASSLEALARESDLFVRMEAIKALAVWGTKEQVPLLLQVLQEKSPHSTLTRLRALEALAQIKDEQTAEAVAECLIDLGLRAQAARALLALGSKAEKVVLKYLTNQDRFVRWEVCKLLKEIGTSASVPALDQLLRNPAPENEWAREALEAIARRRK